MAEVDRYTIQEIGIPGAVLMERAGVAAAAACLALLPDSPRRSVVICCGPGNNGGDGFVIARELAANGCSVTVCLLGSRARLRGDARRAQRIAGKLGIPITGFNSAMARLLANADLIVDALLGTGARGPLRPAFREMCQAINTSSAAVLSVDLPSGIDADSGAADADAVCATRTVTFGALKTGLVLEPGRSRAGRVTVANIGFPGLAFDHVGPHTFLLKRAHAARLMPAREPATFKNRCGQVFVLAGSAGMEGAASLTSHSALLAGAGLVVLGAPHAVSGSAVVPAEVIRQRLPDDGGRLSSEGWPEIARRCEWADAVAAGPGLGVSSDTAMIVKRLVDRYDGLLILDADALNVLEGETNLLQARSAPTILTPHPGEFRRLAGIPRDKDIGVPTEAARDFARKFGVHLLLKGAPSVAAGPDGKVFVNQAGNPGMATAGMGDVLTGVIAGLAAQTKDAGRAMLTGMFSHSYAADLAVRKTGQLALTAGLVRDALPKAMRKLERRAGN